MNAKDFLKEKGISNSDFMNSGVADLIETLLTEYQNLQLQQTGVSSSVFKENKCNYAMPDCKHCALANCIYLNDGGL